MTTLSLLRKSRTARTRRLLRRLSQEMIDEDSAEEAIKQDPGGEHGVPTIGKQTGLGYGSPSSRQQAQNGDGTMANGQTAYEQPPI